jgi:hypothetical protein
VLRLNGPMIKNDATEAMKGRGRLPSGGNDAFVPRLAAAHVVLLSLQNVRPSAVHPWDLHERSASVPGALSEEEPVESLFQGFEILSDST